jgi:hypothetical protein
LRRVQPFASFQHVSCLAAPLARSLLEQMQSDLQAGRFVYRAPWAQDSGAKTGHTAASSLAAFLTPGVLDVRRSSATHTLVCRLLLLSAEFADGCCAANCVQ